MGRTTDRSTGARAAVGALTCALLVSLVVAGGVAADATLTVAVIEARAVAIDDEQSCEQPLTDTATCSASSSGARDGATSSSSASVDATLGHDDLGFLTSLSAHGTAAGQAESPGGSRPADGEADSSVVVHFDVERRITVTIQGSLGVAGNGASACSRVRIFGPGRTELDVRAPGSVCGASGGTFDASPDERVELAAGSYQLMVDAYGGASLDAGGGTASSQSTYDIDVKLLACDNEYTDGPDLITGTPGDDVLCGGPGDDDIFGLGGNDRILGGGGDDTIEGGPGDDVIDAGPGPDRFVDGGDGHDRIDGGPGDDGTFVPSGMSFTGGDGNDVLIGGDGVNIMSGGPGADRIEGGPLVDFINGDGGNDTIDGTGGDDSLYGGEGNDEIDGGPGDEVEGHGRWAGIDGGPGDDLLIGGRGDDLIDGGGGADALNGGPGADKLRGGAAGDVLVGGGGRDVLNGGGGPDDLRARDGARDSVLGGPGHDEATVDRADGVSGVEIVRR